MGIGHYMYDKNIIENKRSWGDNLLGEVLMIGQSKAESPLIKQQSSIGSLHLMKELVLV